MLYEIISPDAFLRPFVADYTTVSSIYVVVRNAYAKVYVDRAFQRKTNELVQRHIDTNQIASIGNFVEIGSDTIELIKRQSGGDGTKVINLIKSRRLPRRTAKTRSWSRSRNAPRPCRRAMRTVRRRPARRWTNFSMQFNRTCGADANRQHVAWMASAISSFASSWTRA